MRIAYLDCFSGISGDMLLGALVHAGVDPELFRRAIAALGVSARIEVETVNRSGISSTKVHVITAGGEEDHAHAVLDHDHGHEDHHHHDHGHGAHPPSPAHHEHHGRSLHDIRHLIGRAALDPAAQRIALRAFQMLGEAEAKIHNIPLERIHFHEVGAVDAIVDIVCCAVGCVSLGVDRWICSPLNVGGGTVRCAHGVFPVPAPAAAELLKGAPTYSSGIEAELVTPTGAALLRALEVEFAAQPPLRAERIGYGAGSRDLAGIANVVRITVGEAVALKSGAADDTETIVVLETSVDDCTPQVLGYVIEQALAAGALDAFIVPVQMKKSRPGQLLTVLCRPEIADDIATLLLRETTTLGVRMRKEERRCLRREFEAVTTPWGEVRVKLAYLGDQLANAAPEFDDCRRLAEEHGVALKKVMQEALRALERRRASANVT
jgi:uncharacterized protein (TIGR00299 family) protein